MSNFKKDTKTNKNTTLLTGLSLQGSHINLSTRLSNFNISNPSHYSYNENVDKPARGRPMSASTLGTTYYQESPRRSMLVNRPQSADTINTTVKNRHITFDFNDQQNVIGTRNHMDLDSTFDELDAAELSSSGRSTPDKDKKQSYNYGLESQPNLEPGLTSKPPIPPTGSYVQSETFVREPRNSVTFDDAIELKFQRWFPNSAVPITTSSAADISLNGMSYEYSERVIDNDKGTITYTRSSSSMSIRGSQDQLDEDHLYSNLNAAIGNGDKLKTTVSVDLLEILQNDDNRRLPSAKLKKKKKVMSVVNKVKKDPSKSVIKSKPIVTVGSESVSLDEKINTSEKQHSRKEENSPVDFSKEDVISWMSSHQRPPTPEINESFDTFHNENHKMSTYDEIVNILKELESENNDIDMNVRKSGVTDNKKHRSLVPEPSSSSKALWSFLDEVDKNSNRSTPSKSPKHKPPVIMSNTSTPPLSPGANATDVKKGKLQQVIELGKAELAQEVAMLQLQLAEKVDVTTKLKMTIAELQAEHAKNKAEYESTVMRHQQFIDKLLHEKKELSESCSLTVKELTKKMNDALASQEERQKIELKKAIEKQTASEKIKKDRWVDIKTKKIKEMTIKGIEPELNRLSAAYQEELSELRRIHQTQIEEIEATWHRRMAAMRDKMDAEREQAVVIERENSRNRLEMEISELEKSYQEQRKRLLNEIHGERLRQEKENDVTLLEKQRVLENKFEKLVSELQEKINKKEQEFQNELKTIRDTCESEKTKWIKHQTIVLADKENSIKEMYKKERDKHIELVVQKLENEAFEREKTSETKIKRIKSEYEADIHELENTLSGHRLKLNEARTKLQEHEEKIADLTSELNKCYIENKRLQEVISKLKEDLIVKENTIKKDTITKVESLKSELNQSKLNFETKIKTIENEKEIEINRVYVRVKEAIKRKDEAIQALQSERDAALDQCSNMEMLLERQRKEILKIK